MVKEDSITFGLAELSSAVYQTISCVFKQDQKDSVIDIQ